jgi:hypothetical protein
MSAQQVLALIQDLVYQWMFKNPVDSTMVLCLALALLMCLALGPRNSILAGFCVYLALSPGIDFLWNYALHT